MTVTWRNQIVAYCVLLIARMFADDPQLKQDLRTRSNNITEQRPSDSAAVARPVGARQSEFQVVSEPVE